MQSPVKAALHGVTVRHDFVTEQLIKAQWHRPKLKMVDEGDCKLTVPGGRVMGVVVPEYRILT